MKKVFILGILVIVLLSSFMGCAAGPNELENEEKPEGDVAGFFQGLWHGIISLVTLIISLFNENVSVYEVYNNGGWYDFGFILGMMIIYGGGGGASKMGYKRYKE